MKELIAIPVYNEEHNLEAVLQKARRYSQEILVINDGSTDGTAKLLAQQSGLHIVNHAYKEGYGAAILSAFTYVLDHDIDILITLDGDGQHDPSYIPEFLREIQNADLVLGSRYLRHFEQNTPTPKERYQINRMITQELNQCLKLKLTDVFCGFIAYRRSVLKQLHLTEMGYGMVLQVCVHAARLGLRIKEAAIPRLYLDPNRKFGGKLNDTDTRIAFYRRVISNALSDDIK